MNVGKPTFLGCSWPATLVEAKVSLFGQSLKEERLQQQLTHT
jgi:hypothetical protein